MNRLVVLMCTAVFMFLPAGRTEAQNTDDIIEIWAGIADTGRKCVPEKSRYGLYKIIVRDGKAVFTPLATGDRRFACNGGGFISDGHCKYVSTKGSRAVLRSFNTVNWKEEGASGEDVSEQEITASAAAFEEGTDRVYGCLSYDKGREHSYGYIDYVNMRSTKIGYNDEHYISMALDSTGTLYAINADGELHTIDRRSGDRTVIGSTNIKPDAVSQAMAYSAGSGRMYWAAVPEKGIPALYEINLSTGAASKVCSLAPGDRITLMYIPRQPEASAPARLSDMEVAFEGALNKGNITFTMPDEYYDGTPMDGDVTYDIIINGKLAGSASAAPGSRVNETVMCTDAGMYEFQVVLKKNGKQNAYNSMSQWVGYDEPAPIRNLKYYSDMNRMVYLRWKAPSGGKHGGYIDRDNLVYKIVRNPGGLVVAEECTETHFEDDTSSGNSNSFYYEVTPYIKEKK